MRWVISTCPMRSNSPIPAQQCLGPPPVTDADLATVLDLMCNPIGRPSTAPKTNHGRPKVVHSFPHGGAVHSLYDEAYGMHQHQGGTPATEDPMAPPIHPGLGGPESGLGPRADHLGFVLGHATATSPSELRGLGVPGRDLFAAKSWICSPPPSAPVLATQAAAELATSNSSARAPKG